MGARASCGHFVRNLHSSPTAARLVADVGIIGAIRSRSAAMLAVIEALNHTIG
jgi:hypothetical protein